VERSTCRCRPIVAGDGRRERQAGSRLQDMLQLHRAAPCRSGGPAWNRLVVGPEASGVASTLVWCGHVDECRRLVLYWGFHCRVYHVEMWSFVLIVMHAQNENACLLTLTDIESRDRPKFGFGFGADWTDSASFVLWLLAKIRFWPKKFRGFGVCRKFTLH